MPDMNGDLNATEAECRGPDRRYSCGGFGVSGSGQDHGGDHGG
ncbi:hypothetical protein ACFSNO_01710 [Streptomyces cirratus]